MKCTCGGLFLFATRGSREIAKNINKIGVYRRGTIIRENSAANVIWAALEYNKYEAER
jgi:hypothetical protein